MRKYAMAACLFMAALNVCAQTKEKDSLRVIDLQEVEIISTRATGTTPVAFTNINKEQLKEFAAQTEPASTSPPTAFPSTMPKAIMYSG